jgi:hypothetical protein
MKLRIVTPGGNILYGTIITPEKQQKKAVKTPTKKAKKKAPLKK